MRLLLFAKVSNHKGGRQMVRNGIIAILVICCAAFFSGCVAARHAADTQEGLQGNKLTVGTVQKEIKKVCRGQK